MCSRGSKLPLWVGTDRRAVRLRIHHPSARRAQRSRPTGSSPQGTQRSQKKRLIIPDAAEFRASTLRPPFLRGAAAPPCRPAKSGLLLAPQSDAAFLAYTVRKTRADGKPPCACIREVTARQPVAALQTTSTHAQNPRLPCPKSDYRWSKSAPAILRQLWGNTG